MAGGDEGEGDKKGDHAPSPQPSPIKGEGDLVRVNVYFWEVKRKSVWVILRFSEKQLFCF